MDTSQAASGMVTITGACITRWWPVARRRVTCWTVCCGRGVCIRLMAPWTSFWGWLITSLDKERYPADKLLALYRKRGKAEAHMGELMDVLDPALSSTRRPKKDYPAVQATTDTGVRANNETLFLLNMLAYEILHMGRTLMEKATREGWSLRRFRERILRVASRVICHGRRLTFVIAQSAADDWQRLWQTLNRLRWAPG